MFISCANNNNIQYILFGYVLGGNKMHKVFVINSCVFLCCRWQLALQFGQSHTWANETTIVFPSPVMTWKGGYATAIDSAELTGGNGTYCRLQTAEVVMPISSNKAIPLKTLRMELPWYTIYMYTRSSCRHTRWMYSIFGDLNSKFNFP